MIGWTSSSDGGEARRILLGNLLEGGHLIPARIMTAVYTTSEDRQTHLGKHLVLISSVFIVAYWAMIYNVTSHRGSTAVPHNPARITCLTDTSIRYFADGKPEA
jgi:hypothetical protein